MRPTHTLNCRRRIVVRPHPFGWCCVLSSPLVGVVALDSSSFLSFFGVVLLYALGWCFFLLVTKRKMFSLDLVVTTSPVATSRPKMFVGGLIAHKPLCINPSRAPHSSFRAHARSLNNAWSTKTHDSVLIFAVCPYQV